MKRLLKSWVFWAFAVPAAVLPFLLGRFVEEDWSSCRCGSGRIESWPRLGIETVGTVRSGPRSIRDFPSELRRHALDESHIHSWISQYGWTRPAEAVLRGVPYMQQPRILSLICREEPAFLAWLKGQCAAGAISPLQVETEISSGTTYAEGRYPFGWKP